MAAASFRRVRFRAGQVRRHGRWLAALFAWALAPLSGAEGPRLPAWRERMAGIEPRGHVAHRAVNPPVIDGRIDDPAWMAAPWTADFVDIEGDVKPRPSLRTRAKILWDERFLYVAAELEEQHLWGKLTEHDAVIFQDPDFEVFLDPDGDTHGYYEFEINALNTGWDLFLPKPYIDGGKARNEWEIPGLRTAVHLRGTLNDPRDTDIGWTVEMAFPWAAFRPPGSGSGAVAPAPADGDIWRMNFSRVQWQVVTSSGRYEKVPNTPEDNWVWSPQGVIDMHRPEMWGRVLFSGKPASVAVVLPPVPGSDARRRAVELYYAQLDHRRAQGRWGQTLDELKWSASAGVPAPELQATADGYRFAVPFREAERTGRWVIRQDRGLTLEVRN